MINTRGPNPTHCFKCRMPIGTPCTCTDKPGGRSTNGAPHCPIHCGAVMDDPVDPVCCPHDWVKQDAYCDPANVLRFKCATCSVWGYKQLGGGCRPTIAPYKRKGVYVMEPDAAWASAPDHERLSWRAVGGSQPDRADWDDHSSNRRHPRRQ